LPLTAGNIKSVAQRADNVKNIPFSAFGKKLCSSSPDAEKYVNNAFFNLMNTQRTAQDGSFFINLYVQKLPGLCGFRKVARN
jgi:hypothetical protein